MRCVVLCCAVFCDVLCCAVVVCVLSIDGRLVGPPFGQAIELASSLSTATAASAMDSAVIGTRGYLLPIAAGVTGGSTAGPTGSGGSTSGSGGAGASSAAAASSATGVTSVPRSGSSGSGVWAGAVVGAATPSFPTLRETVVAAAPPTGATAGPGMCFVVSVLDSAMRCVWLRGGADTRCLCGYVRRDSLRSPSFPAL